MTVRTRTITATAIAIIAVAVIVYLGLYDPTQYPAPRCMFKALTGYQCPGCGTQRAVHALLHGHPGQAWTYNPALFILAPLAALYLWNPRRLQPILHSWRTTATIAAAIILWWIGRNVF